MDAFNIRFCACHTYVLSHDAQSCTPCALPAGPASAKVNAVAALQDCIEKSVVLGLAAQRDSGSPALSGLVSAYASLLAAQVRRLSTGCFA